MLCMTSLVVVTLLLCVSQAKAYPNQSANGHAFVKRSPLPSRTPSSDWHQYPMRYDANHSDIHEENLSQNDAVEEEHQQPDLTPARQRLLDDINALLGAGTFVEDDVNIPYGNAAIRLQRISQMIHEVISGSVKHLPALHDPNANSHKERYEVALDQLKVVILRNAGKKNKHGQMLDAVEDIALQAIDAKQRLQERYREMCNDFYDGE